ncbi:major facilitator superfamily domain-containing protein [Pyronema omphalodes]|nr:major facilitator superfamily domain-containing protein [Pyronema omphalodes]
MPTDIERCPPTEQDPLLPKDDNPEAPNLDNDSPKVADANLKYILPALGIGIFLAAMDNTIVVSSYGEIGNDLKELNRTSWIATAYLLTTTSFQPLYGKLCDIFSRKSCLLFAYVVFGLGCLGCGLSRTMGELVASRAFAGIGGGGMTTVVSIIISDLVPLRSRGTWQGVLNIIFSSGAAAGAPLGGLMADTVGWRWSFLVQVPGTALACIAVGAFLNLPSTPISTTPFKTRLMRVDFLGAFILVLAVLSLLLGLDMASNISLTSPIVVAALTSAVTLFITFACVEGWVAAEPFAPGPIVRERTILSASMSNFFAFAAHMNLLFYTPLYYQAVGLLSASESGIRLLPAIFCGVSGSLAGGLIMQKTGKFYWLTVAAYVLMVIGASIVLISTSFYDSTLGACFGVAVSAVGNGIGVTTALVALIAAAGTKDQAVATAVSYLFRALGTVMGVSFGSMLVQNKLRKELLARLTGDNVEEIVRKVRESMDFIQTLPAEMRDIVRECYRDSLQLAFVFALGLAICAVVAAAFMKERRLS